jgi:hypothetical protein
MHRSGTSLVARLFFEAGADMGDPNTFYRPDKWNPDGYYEQPDIHAINMPLIHGPWGRLAYLRPPSAHTILRRARLTADQIRQTATKYQQTIIKETRFCLTLPAWLEHGARVDAVLICLRDPIQVAQSLRRRNKIPLALGFKLWKLHHQRLMDSCDNIPLRLIYYRNLLDRQTFAAEMRPAFHLFEMEVSDHRLETLHRQVVHPEMNHGLSAEVAYPQPVGDFWRSLLVRHSAQLP